MIEVTHKHPNDWEKIQTCDRCGVEFNYLDKIVKVYPLPDNQRNSYSSYTVHLGCLLRKSLDATITLNVNKCEHCKCNTIADPEICIVSNVNGMSYINVIHRGCLLEIADKVATPSNILSYIALRDNKKPVEQFSSREIEVYEETYRIHTLLKQFIHCKDIQWSKDFSIKDNIFYAPKDSYFHVDSYKRAQINNLRDFVKYTIVHMLEYYAREYYVKGSIVANHVYFMVDLFNEQRVIEEVLDDVLYRLLFSNDVVIRRKSVFLLNLYKEATNVSNI